MKLMMYAQVSSLGKVTQLAKRIEFEIHFTRLTFLAVTHGVEKKLSRRLRLSKSNVTRSEPETCLSPLALVT